MEIYFSRFVFMKMAYISIVIYSNLFFALFQCFIFIENKRLQFCTFGIYFIHISSLFTLVWIANRSIIDRGKYKDVVCTNESKVTIKLSPSQQ